MRRDTTTGQDAQASQPRRRHLGVAIAAVLALTSPWALAAENPPSTSAAASDHAKVTSAAATLRNACDAWHDGSAGLLQGILSDDTAAVACQRVEDTGTNDTGLFSMAVLAIGSVFVARGVLDVFRRSSNGGAIQN